MFDWVDTNVSPWWRTSPLENREIYCVKLSTRTRSAVVRELFYNMQIIVETPVKNGLNKIDLLFLFIADDCAYLQRTSVTDHGTDVIDNRKSSDDAVSNDNATAGSSRFPFIRRVQTSSGLGQLCHVVGCASHVTDVNTGAGGEASCASYRPKVRCVVAKCRPDWDSRRRPVTSAVATEPRRTDDAGAQLRDEFNTVPVARRWQPSDCEPTMSGIRPCLSSTEISRIACGKQLVNGCSSTRQHRHRHRTGSVTSVDGSRRELYAEMSGRGNRSITTNSRYITDTGVI